MTGLELVLVNFVVAVGKRLGDKWIDRIAGGIDARLTAILKLVRQRPEQAKAAQEYLESHEEVTERVRANVQAVLEAAQVETPLVGLLNMPRAGRRLEYYKNIIDWLIDLRSYLRRDFVLKGFFNGSEYLTYVSFDSYVGDIDDAKSEVIIEDRYVCIYPRCGLEIHLEKMSSIAQRDRKFTEINSSLELSSSGELGYDYLQPGKIREVIAIFDRWISYNTGLGLQDFSRLPKDQQKQQEIASYAPLGEMLASAYELIIMEEDEIQRLSMVINGATLDY